MSFDLALRKGDLSVGADGDLEKVRNTQKAVQDTLKVIHTPIGSNPFATNIGTNITSANIGENISSEFAETKVAASVTQAIQTIQAIQRRQEQIQVVTPEEKIIRIANLEVGQNEQDPRQYDISLGVVNGALDTVNLEQFSISTTVSN